MHLNYIIVLCGGAGIGKSTLAVDTVSFNGTTDYRTADNVICLDGWAGSGGSLVHL